jgi:hypothetical protein
MNDPREIALNDFVRASTYRRWNYGDVLTVVSALALVVPFCTGWVAYSFNVTESLPIQPRALLISLAVFSGINAFRFKLKLPLSVCILMLLLGVRLGDSLLLNRVDETVLDPISVGLSSIVFLVGVLYMSMDTKGCTTAPLACSVATAMICAVGNCIQWLDPSYFGAGMGRPGGWLINPNTSAMTISLMMAVSLVFLKNRWAAVVAILVSGIGIFLTFSRSGVLVWLATAITYFVMTARSRKNVIIAGSLMALVLFFGIAVFSVLHERSTNADVAKRLEHFKASSLGDLDDTDRITVLVDAIGGALNEPVVGYGTLASSTQFHPHNMWVGAWIDSGLAGIVLLGIAFFLLCRELAIGGYKRMTLFVALGLWTLFSHNLLTDQTFLFCWVVCAGGKWTAVKDNFDARGRDYSQPN